MAWKLDIDLETLETENENLKSQIRALHTEINEMAKLIEIMRNFWEGDAAEAYIDAMDIKLVHACGAQLALERLQRAVETQINDLKENDQWFEKLWYGIWHW